jgi:hypothetical protein
VTRWRRRSRTCNRATSQTLWRRRSRACGITSFTRTLRTCSILEN